MYVKYSAAHGRLLRDEWTFRLQFSHSGTILVVLESFVRGRRATTRHKKWDVVSAWYYRDSDSRNLMEHQRILKPDIPEDVFAAVTEKIQSSIHFTDR